MMTKSPKLKINTQLAKFSNWHRLPVDLHYIASYQCKYYLTVLATIAIYTYNHLII